MYYTSLGRADNRNSGETGHKVYYRKSQGAKCYRKMKAERREREWAGTICDMIFIKETSERDHKGGEGLDSAGL